MGAPRIWEGKDLVELRRRFRGADPKAPPEDNADGCPGAWYRCTFAASVSHYERTLLQDAIANNPRLDRTDDPLVIEAAGYLEYERLRHRNYWRDKISGP